MQSLKAMCQLLCYYVAYFLLFQLHVKETSVELGSSLSMAVPLKAFSEIEGLKFSFILVKI